MGGLLKYLMFQYKPLLGHLKEMIERTNAILRLHSPAPNQLICIPAVKIYTDKTHRHNMSMTQREESEIY